MARKVVYTHKIQQAIEGSKNIVNLSAVGASLDDQLKMLLLLNHMNVKVEKLIIEFNAPNARPDLEKAWPSEKTFAEEKIVISPSIPYLEFFLKHPLGKSFIPMVFNQYNYSQSEQETISVVPLSQNYYLSPDLLDESRVLMERYFRSYAHYGNLVADKFIYLFHLLLMMLFRKQAIVKKRYVRPTICFIPCAKNKKI